MEGLIFGGETALQNRSGKLIVGRQIKQNYVLHIKVFVVSFVVSFDVQNGIVCLGVDQLLTDTSVKYRSNIGEVSAECWRGTGKVSVNRKAISADIHLD